MNSHAEKTQQDTSKAVANSLPKQQDKVESALEFEDNRPETVQRKGLQEVANNSPRNLQLKAVQEMANKHVIQKQHTVQRVSEHRVGSVSPGAQSEVSKATDNNSSDQIQQTGNSKIVQRKIDQIDGYNAFTLLDKLKGDCPGYIGTKIQEVLELIRNESETYTTYEAVKKRALELLPKKEEVSIGKLRLTLVFKEDTYDQEITINTSNNTMTTSYFLMEKQYVTEEDKKQFERLEGDISEKTTSETGRSYSFRDTGGFEYTLNVILDGKGGATSAELNWKNTKLAISGILENSSLSQF